MTDRDLYRIGVLYDPPGYVKQASAVDILGEESDPPSVFADPHSRAYCTRSKAATWVSYAHFLDTVDGLAPERRAAIANRLAKAASYFRIHPDIGLLRQKHSSHAAVDDAAVSDSRFGWVVKDARDGTAGRHLRLLNAAEVEKAAAWLLEHRDAFLYPDRMKIARRILIRAGEEHASVPVDDLDKIAGYGGSTSDAVVDAITARIGLLRTKKADPRILESLAFLRDTVDGSPAALKDRERRIKLATLLDRLDRDNGLQASYRSDGLPRPEETIFGITQKVAQDFLGRYLHVKTGAVYLRSDIGRVGVVDLGELVGRDLAGLLSDDGILLDGEKAAAAAESMTVGETTMLEHALAQLGVTPVERLTSARHRSMRAR